MKVPFLDLGSAHREIESAVLRRLRRLFKDGDYILGKDVRDFEAAFARFAGAAFSIGVNSGTDALFLGLKALGVGPGDEVIVPVYTYIASAYAVSYTGARPVFVDIDPGTYNIDPNLVPRAITRRTRALMPVHLYGQCADMTQLCLLAKHRRIPIVEDAAQAHGAALAGRRAGSWGDCAAFSFYPTKNLGGPGDAGAITTNRPDLHKALLKLRDYGRTTRYEHDAIGYNSRLDSIQAIFLSEKLKRLDGWNRARRRIAQMYRALLKDTPGITLPAESAPSYHAYHIFAIRVKARDRVLASLRKAGVGAAVHYPVPLHVQKVYKALRHKKGDFPVAERVAREVLCLPIHPHMDEKHVRFVVRLLKRLVKE